MNATLRTAHRPVLWDVVNEFDNIFDGFLKPVKTRTAESSAIVPAIDISETDTAYTLTADMPGVAREDLEVTIEEGTLSFGTRETQAADATDAADSEVDTPVSASRRIRTERRVGAYNRTLKLADDVDESAVHASLKDGVLTLTLPKEAKIEPRKIDVTVS